jgi:hypothetical protein
MKGGSLAPAVLPLKTVGPSDVTLTQSSSFTNSNTLNFTHTLSAGAVALSQSSRYDNSNTLNFTHTLTQAGANQNLSQSARFDNSQAFYTHSLAASIALTQSSRFDNANSLALTHTLTAAVSLTQSARFDNANSLAYQHEITQGAGGQTLTQTVTFANGQTWYAHTLTTGEVLLNQTARFDGIPTFFNHSISQIQQLTQTALFKNTEADMPTAAEIADAVIAALYAASPPIPVNVEEMNGDPVPGYVVPLTLPQFVALKD